ncbi:molybdopterin molybdotransferase MoeA [Paenibacillus spongiae]|uniref:Molybdopterin molybdenumtransferase n=1 Tax=Paenibacillus spongiae TaxID=2909671 RepID=A0ABY5SHV2_9BACL|nr:molybdopterin molybdotransferase MoeA [Paenibacillus spongiae]UVI33564.1 molybdopterin molybdotransferase MoeA [Paenibacillus spongiae]
MPVYARPRVAVLATGAELQPVEAPLAPGCIRDSNSAMVAALIEQCGGQPILLGRLEDEPAAVSAALADAMRHADVIVTTGGVSVGDYDVMAAIMRGIGEDRSEAHANKPLFDKVSMRPGSPTSAAVMNGKLLFALSGNPGACFVGFELFVRPALQRLQGVEAEASLPVQVTAKLAADFDKGSPHERFVRTRLYVDGGVLHADPLAFGKSSMMASIPDADGLIRIPAGASGAASGTLVEVILLNNRLL